MGEYVKLMWGLVIAVISVMLLAFVGNMLGFAQFAFFAPRIEQVRYDTFKQSQAYNDGMIRDLENLKLQYMQANPEQKAALRGIVLHRFSVYDTNRLPTDLQVFINQVQGVQQ